MSTAQYRERRSWTPQEDRLLREAIDCEDPGTTSPSKWHAIAKHVPGRTNKDCRKRWFAKMASDVIKGGWSAYEDEKLVSAIKKYGTRWSMVATLVQTRNSDQCAKRWTDTLNPTIDRTPWSAAADELLIQAVERHGKVWSKIVRTTFPGRTGLSAKNRYNSITRGGTKPSGSRPQPRLVAPKAESAASSTSSASTSPSPSPVHTPSAESSFDEHINAVPFSSWMDSSEKNVNMNVNMDTLSPFALMIDSPTIPVPTPIRAPPFPDYQPSYEQQRMVFPQHQPLYGGHGIDAAAFEPVFPSPHFNGTSTADFSNYHGGPSEPRRQSQQHQHQQFTGLDFLSADNRDDHWSVHSRHSNPMATTYGYFQ